MPPATTISPPIEELGHGLKRQWLHEGRILTLTIPPEAARAVSDAWAEATLAAMAEWPNERPFLALHDFSVSGFSRYGSAKADEVVKAIPPHLQGRVALVVTNNVFGNMIRVGSRGMMLFMTKQRLESRFFTNRDAALTWLEELL
jgi:hypothetical protein